MSEALVKDTPMQMLAPASEAEAAARVAEAFSRKSSLSIAGGGTKRAMGRPVTASTEISTRGLTGVTLHEPAEMVMSARAGTPLAAIESELAAKGQMLSFEPPDLRALLGASGEPTIGGAVALNMSGPRRIQSGACRDSLIGVRYINGRGEIIRTGGRVMKNVTGLDVVKLQAGAWGTLGLMSEVTFKVSPCPETSATVLLEGLDDLTAIRALTAAVTSPFEVSGAAHLPAGGVNKSRTLVRIEHFAPSVAYRTGEIARLWRTYGAAAILDDAASRILWRDIAQVRHFTHASLDAVWRISMKPTQSPAFVAALPPGLVKRHAYDWGGGLVWLAVAQDHDCGAQVIRATLARFGGYALLVRADAGMRERIDVLPPLPQALARLQERVRLSIDPAGLFNPGRMYAPGRSAA